jgi:hypothetical protein
LPGNTASTTTPLISSSLPGLFPSFVDTVLELLKG